MHTPLTAFAPLSSRTKGACALVLLIGLLVRGEYVGSDESKVIDG